MPSTEQLTEKIPAVETRRKILLPIRLVQFIFGAVTLGLSAASISLTKNYPGRATSDNALLIAASALGLVTVFYRILTWRINENEHRHRFIPIVIECVVICLLLAAFIYGAVSTARGSGACGNFAGGDADEDNDNDNGAAANPVNPLLRNTANNGACRLTKAATAFGAGTWLSFVASAYTVAKGMYDEASG